MCKFWQPFFARNKRPPIDEGSALPPRLRIVLSAPTTDRIEHGSSMLKRSVETRFSPELRKRRALQNFFGGSNARSGPYAWALDNFQASQRQVSCTPELGSETLLI